MTTHPDPQSAPNSLTGRLKGTRALERRPISPAVALCLTGSALGWLGLAVLAKGGTELALCSAPGNSISGQLESVIAYQFFYANPLRLAVEWTLMVMAMMLPLALPHVTLYVRGLYRRDRANGLFGALAGFLVIWALLGVVAVPLMLTLHAISSVSGPFVPILAYAIAIAWAWSSYRLRAFRKCHAIPAPCGTGVAILRASGAYGVRLGLFCVVTCGFAMMAPMLAGQSVFAMVVLTHVLLKERLMHKPRPMYTAAPLALLGSLALFQSAV